MLRNTNPQQVSDAHNDTIKFSDLPLNNYRLIPEEVSVLYAALLGRAPDNQHVWTDRSALESILAIAQSPEARARNTFQSDLQITEGRFGTFVTYQKDLVIGAAIRTNGQFEEDLVAQTLNLLKYLGEDIQLSTFLDIGANIGTHNIAALRTGFKNAICVEADHQNFTLLKINHLINKLGEQCIDVHSAISDSDGTATLELSSTNFGDHRIKVDVARNILSLHGEEGRDTRVVPVHRLDTLLSQLKIEAAQIGLAWIDTQGHEGHVLSGASALLASRTPIVMEFWPYGLHRAGGYQLLRSALMRRSRCFDLRRSFESQSPIACTSEDLDKMFMEGLTQESAAFSPHTDLLVL